MHRLLVAFGPIDRAVARALSPLLGGLEALFGCSSKTLALRILDIGLIGFVVIHVLSASATGESGVTLALLVVVYAGGWWRDRQTIAAYSPPGEVLGPEDVRQIFSRVTSQVATIMVASMLGALTIQVSVAGGTDGALSMMFNLGTIFFWVADSVAHHAVARGNRGRKSVVRRAVEALREAREPALVPVRTSR